MQCSTSQFLPIYQGCDFCYEVTKITQCEEGPTIEDYRAFGYHAYLWICPICQSQNTMCFEEEGGK